MKQTKGNKIAEKQQKQRLNTQLFRMGHVDSMPKELGPNQSGGPTSAWKWQNQINGVYKKKKSREQTDFEGNIMFLPKSLDSKKERQMILPRYMTVGS